MMAMKWRLASGSLKSSSSSVSAKPEMEVSGVASSWAALLTNSAWRWLISCRREMSWKTARTSSSGPS